MRDQYAGDVSDAIKFAFLRALAGEDRRLGIAWYYAPGDDGKADGRHLEWRNEPGWNTLDPILRDGLANIPERSIAALERAPIWPQGVAFHRTEMPMRSERANWAAKKRDALSGSDIVFLDPDNGIGEATEKHATLAEVAELRKPGRAIVFITFPGRSLPHEQLLQQLHERIALEIQSHSVVTLRSNVSVPTAPGSKMLVQRQRWFTVVDADELLLARTAAFAEALSQIPRISARVDPFASPTLPVTKASAIREMHGQGIPIAEIARRLGIRYQHAYNVVKSSLVSGDGKAQAVAASPTPSATKPTKPPLTASALISGGFQLSSRWLLGPEGDLLLEQPLPKTPGVYSFVKNGLAQYVGLASMGLAKRIYFYARPGISQRTSQRLNAVLKNELRDGSTIDIFTAIPPDMTWNGLPVHGSAGLELGLIKRHSLPWNMRSAG